NVVLDLAGGKAIIGRAPAAAARVTRAVAPTSRAAARATRRYSGLTRAERARLARQTRQAVGVTPRNRPRFAPGEGGLYREPRRVEGRPVEASEVGRNPIPPTVVEVPRRPYSRDFINRAVQRAADRARAR